MWTPIKFFDHKKEISCGTVEYYSLPPSTFRKKSTSMDKEADGASALYFSISRDLSPPLASFAWSTSL